jgi:hypothetical protein
LLRTEGAVGKEKKLQKLDLLCKDTKSSAQGAVATTVLVSEICLRAKLLKAGLSKLKQEALNFHDFKGEQNRELCVCRLGSDNMDFQDFFKGFIEYNKTLIVGVVAGLISGIFFAVYYDLSSQIFDGKLLLGASLFVAAVWYFIILGISFIFYTISKIIIARK